MGTVQNILFQSLLKLEAIRSENDVFGTSAEFHTINTGSNNVLGIYRKLKNQRLLAYFNFNEVEQSVFFDTFIKGKDLFHDKEIKGMATTLEPFGFLWLLLDQ